MTNWVALSNENYPRRDFGCVLVDSHRVLVCGGQNEETGLKSAFIWNCETKSSTEIADLPTEIAFCRAVFLDGYAYAMGSNTNFFRINVNDSSSSWERMSASRPVGAGFALVVSGKRIYQTGGYLMPNSMNSYDPDTDKWEQEPNMPNGLRGHDSVEVNGEIYVIGGLTVPDNHVTGDVSIFGIEGVWKVGPKAPRHSMDQSLTVTGTNIIMIGGQPGRVVDPISTVYVLDTWAKKWTVHSDQASLPKSSTCHRAIATNYQLFVFGGCAKRDSNTKEFRNYSESIFVIDLSVFGQSNDGATEPLRPESTTSHKPKFLCFC